MGTAQLECQPIQEVDSIEQDIREINQLQMAFNAATGIKVVGKDLRNRSYNPVIDRWHVEKIGNDQEKLSNYLSEVRRNINTNLQERMFAVETESRFLIVDGKLRSELLPEESFGQVILRGANWRAAHGSEEQKREGMLGELAGWLQINDALVNGEVGTKVVSFSPQGRIKNTSYDGRYVDIYEKTNDEEKPIKRTRIAVDFDDEKYEQTARALDPKFFDNYDARPIDAWYLSHPVIVKGALPDLLLPTTAMSREEFGKLYKQIETSGLIDHYQQVIQKRPVDWIEVAKTFNTILTIADKIKEGKSISEIIKETMPISIRRDRDIYEDRLMNPSAMVDMLGTKRVKQVGGGGCPPNRGFDFADSSSDPLERFSVDAQLQDLLGNSAGQFGLSTKETWDYHEGYCVLCKDKKKKLVGPCDICQEHEKQF